MTVSALIPTYNRRAFVQRAIDSVIAQTLPVDEIIVIDDGSTDGTAEIVREKYGPLFQLISQQNQGVSAARRRAVQEAKGDWVAFLDSDDEWTLMHNQLLQSAAKSVPEDVAWIFGDTQPVTDDDSGDTFYRKHGLKIDQLTVFEDKWRVHDPFQFGLLQSSLIRRSALLEIDCFKENLSHSEDYLVGVQVASLYRMAGIPQVVTRLFRTSDLDSTSIESRGMGGEDYYIARIKAYELMGWGEHRADSIRKLCKVKAGRGESVRSLAARQFKSSASLKSMAFFGAAMTGTAGIALWKKISATLGRN